MFLHSASGLIKNSARQLVYRRLNPLVQRPIMDGMNRGTDHQHIVVQSLQERYRGIREDMRGQFDHGNNRIFFCVDAANRKRFFEIKHVRDPLNVENWYLESSLLQSAYYQALLLVGNITELTTPAFMVAQGHQSRTIRVTPNSPYILLFGDKSYCVTPQNPQKLVDFYLDKIAATRNYESARVWDNRYKHKEFSAMKSTFSYEEVK